jgi:succinyl-CoA synthetase beta subunit
MDLLEHQARDLCARHGIAVPRAEVTDSPKEAREIARRLGGRVVVKAQVKTGGRGKAGGVKLAAGPPPPRSPHGRSSAWTSRATPSAR